MDNTIIVALISATIPTIASIATIISQNEKNNALQDERDRTMKEALHKLESKVEQHNNFGIQLAQLETRVEILEKR